MGAAYLKGYTMTLEDLKKLIAELLEEDKNPIIEAIEEAFKDHDYNAHGGDYYDRN